MLLIALLQPIKEVCLLSTYLLSETSPTMASVLITNRIYLYMYIHYIRSTYICFRSTYASNIIALLQPIKEVCLHLKISYLKLKVMWESTNAYFVY